MQVGSADHHIHYYDLRNISQPLHVFSGHRKAVSYVKFLSNNELASASTDSTLRLWDVKENMPVSYYVFIVYFVLSPHYKSLCMVIPANFFSTLTIHFCKILWKLHMVRTTNSSQFLFHNFS